MNISPVNNPSKSYPTPSAGFIQNEDIPEFNPLDYILEGPTENTIASTSVSEYLKVDGVRFNIVGNLINFNQEALMETIQDIHMMLIDNELFFSVDQEKWLPFGDLFTFDCNFNFPLENNSESTELTVNFEVSTKI